MRALTRQIVLAVAVLGLVVGAAGRAEAGILVEYTPGQDSPITAFFGQSVTTPAGGPFDDITFNFFSNVPATTPLAAGDLFILTQEYQGSPGGLSGATSGFLAESTGISGGVYQFAPSVTLQGGTQYFFYTDQTLAPSFANTGTYNGGIEYIAFNLSGGSTTIFFPSSGDLNFRLSGTSVAATPEPSTLTSAGIGALMLAGYAWRKRRKARLAAA